MNAHEGSGDLKNDPSASGLISADGYRGPVYRRWFVFCIFSISLLNVVDRSVISVVGEAIKNDLRLTDTQLGLLGGPAFGLLYASGILPIARLADRFNRVRILGICLAFWSAMTALCGMASSFINLFLARAGVGIGEAGGSTVPLSLICDIFPQHRRATIIGISGSGAAVGVLFSSALSGWLVEQFSWRAAFLVVGLPGLVLALIFVLTVAEPPRGLLDRATQTRTPSLREVARVLFRSKSFVHMMFVAGLATFVTYGMSLFLHPLLVRSFLFDYSTASIVFGVVIFSSSTFGYTVAGFMTDHMVQRDVRYFGWIPAGVMITSALAIIIGMLQSDWRIAVVLLAVGCVGGYTYLAPTFTLTQRLVEPRMRATGIAILTLSVALVGTAGGPMVLGIASDLFASAAFQGTDYAAACKGDRVLVEIQQQCTAASAQGLRTTILVVTPIALIWASIHALLATRTMRADLGVRTTPAS